MLCILMNNKDWFDLNYHLIKLLTPAAQILVNLVCQNSTNWISVAENGTNHGAQNGRNGVGNGTNYSV